MDENTNKIQEATAITNAIARVVIKDFLVFKGEFTADFCAGVNVLIGGNGSGKTTLMKVMYAACQFNGEYDKSMDVYDWSNDFSRVFSNHFEVKPGSYKIQMAIGNSELGNMLDRHRFFVRGNYPIISSYFIPVTNILSHSEGMVELSAKYKTPFDKTELDAFVNAGLPDAQNVIARNKHLLKKISEVIHGEVISLDGVFYVKKDSGEFVELNLEASGYGRLGLLWKYLRNGLLESGSILFWDEPEASINPELIPTLVDILLELQRGGVQVFVATHSYDVARWFELNKRDGDSLRFFNLTNTENGVEEVHADDYVSLPISVIDDADSKMLRRVAEVAARKAGVTLK
jgi:energy-coupling factor transporter ATP-binding protein EcfA2